MAWETRSEEQIEVDEKKGVKIVKEKVIIKDKKGKFVRAFITEHDKDKGTVEREVTIFDGKADRRMLIKKVKNFIKFKPTVRFIEEGKSITIEYDENILADENIVQEEV